MSKRENLDYTSEYNNEPVYFCKSCLSLFIKDAGFMDFCGHCGSTDIGKASLEEYDKLHLQRFGTKKFYK